MFLFRYAKANRLGKRQYITVPKRRGQDRPCRATTKVSHRQTEVEEKGIRGRERWNGEREKEKEEGREKW